MNNNTGQPQSTERSRTFFIIAMIFAAFAALPYISGYGVNDFTVAMAWISGMASGVGISVRIDGR